MSTPTESDPYKRVFGIDASKPVPPSIEQAARTCAERCACQLIDFAESPDDAVDIITPLILEAMRGAENVMLERCAREDQAAFAHYQNLVRELTAKHMHSGNVVDFWRDLNARLSRTEPPAANPPDDAETQLAKEIFPLADDAPVQLKSTARASDVTQTNSSERMQRALEMCRRDVTEQGHRWMPQSYYLAQVIDAALEGQSDRQLPPVTVGEPEPICSECGKPGRHYAPPSMGDPGFYICQTAGDGRESMPDNPGPFETLDTIESLRRERDEARATRDAFKSMLESSVGDVERLTKEREVLLMFQSEYAKCKALFGETENTLHNSIQGERAARNAIIARLRGALEPFEKAIEGHFKGWPDDTRLSLYNDVSISLAHCRAAKSALSDAGPDPVAELRAKLELAESKARDMSHTYTFGAAVLNLHVLPRINSDASGTPLELLGQWLVERDRLREQVRVLQEIVVKLTPTSRKQGVCWCPNHFDLETHGHCDLCVEVRRALAATEPGQTREEYPHGGPADTRQHITQSDNANAVVTQRPRPVEPPCPHCGKDMLGNPYPNETCALHAPGKEAKETL